MIGKNGIIDIVNLYESDAMCMNTSKSGSYIPTKDLNNSCTTIARVEGFVQGKQYYVELTVKWSGFTSNTSSNFGSWFQGSTYNGSSWDWTSSNPLTSAAITAIGNLTSVFTSSDTGEKHGIAVFTANARTGYDLGIRTNYSNGTGKVTVTDVKVIPAEYFVGNTTSNTTTSIGAKILGRDDIEDNLCRNILSQSYTKDNPFSFSSSAKDGIAMTSQRASVTSGSTYYFTAKSDCVWATGHSNNDDTVANHKVTIWLYLSENWTSYQAYDTPIVFCYQDSRWIKDNLWKITIPSGKNWASVRVNQYSDGTNVISAKFWDIALIPESLFTPPIQILCQEKSWSIKSLPKGGDLM